MCFTVYQLIVSLLFSRTTKNSAQKKSSKKDEKVAAKAPKAKPKKGAIQPYEKVVTKKHKTDEGLFKVHTKDQNYTQTLPY